MKAMKKVKMDCSAVRRALLEAFDQGRLESLQDELSAHASACARCQGQWKRLLMLHRGLERVSQPDPGELYWVNFLAALRKRMENESPRPRSDRAWIPSAAMAASLALFLMLSPSRIAPPSWWTAGEGTSYGTGVAGESGDAQLSESLDSETTSDLTLNDAESQFIKDLSLNSRSLYKDPLDAMTEMSDDEIQMFLEKLKSQPIIRS